MSFWPPPPPTTSSTSSPSHSQQDQQQMFHYEHQTETQQGYPIFPHDHTQQTQGGDAFAWQHQQRQQQFSAMNFDPLPMLRSTSETLRRAAVSVEDEIFEARMLQEALQDCEGSTPRPVATHQHQLSAPTAFLPHSFQAQLMYPSHFATTVTPTNNSALLRGSLAVSPVENLRSFMLGQPHQLSATSPSSYSSSSSSRSPVMGLASLQGSTPPSSTNSTSGQTGQPKKRIQTARICHVEGCTRGIRSRGLCKAHGGGRRCTTPGCTTSDQGGGHCVLHGGGRRCRVDGCMKSAQWRGVCKLHGGARRCRYGHCTKNGQVKQGYCRLHYNLLTQQRLQGLLATGSQDERKQEEHEVGHSLVMDASQQHL